MAKKENYLQSVFHNNLSPSTRSTSTLLRRVLSTRHSGKRASPNADFRKEFRRAVLCSQRMWPEQLFFRHREDSGYITRQCLNVDGGNWPG